VRRQLPEAVHLFVLPPRVAILEERLRRRGTDPEDTIRRRMTQVGEQLRGCVDFDYVVVNDHLETASATFTGILLAEMSRCSRRQNAIREILGQIEPR